MNIYLRKLRGVISIGLIWAPVWAALFVALIASVIAVFNPNGGSDVGLLRMIAIIASVGFISGATFGILLSLAESGKAIHDLSLARASLWGTLGSAVFPLLTQREDQVFWTCPFGAIVAISLVALARKASLSQAKQPMRLRDVFLVCVLTPVRDAVNPSTELVT